MAKRKTKPKGPSQSKRRRQPPSKKKVDVEKLRDTDPKMKALFWEVVRGDKAAEDLTPLEIRALIIRVGFLSDEERTRFDSVLVRDNLTDADVDRYGKLQSLDRYFPVRKEN